jgi:DTW domain-containing protein
MSTCYCHLLRPFDPGIRFVILTHRLEARRRIATGRMSHLCLKNSELLRGQDYSDNERVNSIVADEKNHCVILFPGLNSTNLSRVSSEDRLRTFPAQLELIIFVIDGTWSTAGKTLRQSQNLQRLPRICFDPVAPSRFRVRKQPKPHFTSTIEAIHQTIDLVGPARGFDPSLKVHGRLIEIFDHLVEQQLEFVRIRGHSHRHARAKSKLLIPETQTTKIS